MFTVRLKHYDEYKKFIYVLLILLTVAAAILKIFYGWDCDESYLLYLSYRIQDGKKLLTEQWDLYQLTYIFPALALRLFRMISGSFEGAVVFLRVTTTILQITGSFYVYLILKKHYSKDIAFFSMIFLINFLPRATENLEYGLLSVFCTTICCTILIDIWKSSENRSSADHFDLRIIIAGIMYAIAVFSYPTMIISIPAIIIILSKTSSSIKEKLLYAGVFFGVCILLASCFFAYILSYVDVKALPGLIAEMLSSGDHTRRFEPLFEIGNYTGIIRQAGIKLLLVSVIYLLFRRFFPEPVFICYFFMLYFAVFIIVFNLTELRPSGPFGNMERHLVIAMFSLVFYRISKDKTMLWGYFVPGLFIFFGALAGTNLSILGTSMFLEICILAAIIMSLKIIPYMPDLIHKNTAYLAVVLYIISVIISKGYFVRLTGTPPASIRNTDTVMEEGFLRGVHVPSDYKKDIIKREKYLKETTDNSHSYIYMGNEPLNNLFIKGDVVGVQYAATIVPDGQWVDFYEKYECNLPDFIYIDKDKYPEIEDFYGTVFGGYVQDKYVVEDETDIFYVLGQQG